MFGISFEHLLVLGVILVIFGPRRLPELGNTLGKAIRNFKDAVSGVEEAAYRKVEQGPAKVEVTHQANSANSATSAAAPSVSPSVAGPDSRQNSGQDTSPGLNRSGPVADGALSSETRSGTSA